MTPEQLRARAWKHIASARQLLESDPDHASQTVGLAAELALKARFCTRQGWKDFPESREEAKKRGAPERLFTHDLETLLKYTDDIVLKTSSMHSVNWVRASDWSVDQRYTPVGTVTQERAKAQIDETEKLFLELVHWEILEKLVQVEIEQSAARGPFNFFGLVHDQEAGGWRIWLAAWGTPQGVKVRPAATGGAAFKVLDADLWATLKGSESSSADASAAEFLHDVAADGAPEAVHYIAQRGRRHANDAPCLRHHVCELDGDFSSGTSCKAAAT